jgi:L-fuconate dehydratase
VILTTSDGMKGHGMTFTLGKGTNIVCTFVESMKFLLENQELDLILKDFGVFWRKLTSESQLRWVRIENFGRF